ncbi:hypothetical protein [Leptolyngbya sp. O-77]|uniref:hypothetical protein n=1 Tax=Leptolyngbya sp. O-77 TaxID=1080068 RepID=UPI00074D32FC|nr:hypothetical protein [Leptolyngbya sp. O-77]BAU41669.1 hypothetical protein O77CONTIG1_01481 [Leptolyngbya sp. O-77]
MNQHPLQPGQIFSSPGCCYTYRILGPCCRLFDREELPYPCCRLEWRGKEPSWRRIGRRLVPDMGARSSPSYVVEILGQEHANEPFVVTLYWLKLSPEQREWWYSRKLKSPAPPELVSQTNSPSCESPSC